MKFPVPVPGLDRYTVEWELLREVTQRLINGDASDFTRTANKRRAKHVVGSLTDPDTFRDDWRGFTTNQLNDWLAKGYQSPAIHGLRDFAPPIREKRRYVVTEDGDEMLIDLVLGGADSFYGDFTTQDQIPGLAIDAEIGMVASNNNRVLIDYFKWLNRVIYSLDSIGIDCEVTLRYECRNLFNQSGAKTATVVAVKRENQKTDFLSWSPMISPASFRSLMFVANTINADARGFDVSDGQGSRSGGRWSVEYQPEHSTLRLDCEWSSRAFPLDSMQSQFEQCLKQIKGK